MIEVKNLYASYGNTSVLKDISFKLEKGEIVTLVGKSGAGKTTLLKLINGLLPPSRGTFLFDNVDIYKLSTTNIKRQCTQKIGFVWQNYRLISEINVNNNIVLPSLINKEIVDSSYKSELLELLEIKTHLNKYPHQLSGGEQQRVALARALILKPKIIIADEPTGALDSITANKLIELLQKIHKQYKPLILIATHNIELSKIGTRILELSDGKLANEIHK